MMTPPPVARRLLRVHEDGPRVEQPEAEVARARVVEVRREREQVLQALFGADLRRLAVGGDTSDRPCIKSR